MVWLKLERVENVGNNKIFCSLTFILMLNWEHDAEDFVPYSQLFVNTKLKHMREVNIFEKKLSFKSIEGYLQNLYWYIMLKHAITINIAFNKQSQIHNFKNFSHSLSLKIVNSKTTDVIIHYSVRQPKSLRVLKERITSLTQYLAIIYSLLQPVYSYFFLNLGSFSQMILS